MPKPPKPLGPPVKKYVCNELAAAWFGIVELLRPLGLLTGDRFRSALAIARAWVDAYADVHCRTGESLFTRLGVSRQHAQAADGEELVRLAIYIARATQPVSLGAPGIEAAIAADETAIDALKALLLP